MPFLIGNTHDLRYVTFFSLVFNFQYLTYSFSRIVLIIDKNNMFKFRSCSSKIEKGPFLIGSTCGVLHITFFLFVLNFKFLTYSFTQVVIIIDKNNMCKFWSHSSEIKKMVTYHFSHGAGMFTGFTAITFSLSIIWKVFVSKINR